MKIIFFGSPIYTTYIIDQIRCLKYELLAVVTQNEKRGKRGKISKTIDKCIFSVGPNNHHKQGIRMKTCELII